MKKNRKMGPPKRKRKYARSSTSKPSITINLPPGLDFLSQAQAEEVLDLIAEPQEQERVITIRHNMKRWDDPPDTTAHAIVINTKTKETRCYIQRGGKKVWLLKAPDARATVSRNASRESPAPAKHN
jgi:hypothetical protein